jgi:hypothetical protein
MLDSDPCRRGALQQPPRGVSLAQIDALVAEHLGPGRIRGNSQPAVLYRQIAMYLAKKVGGWSAVQIGRFYNGRDHSTVCHALTKIEALRLSRPEIEKIIDHLTEILQSVGSESGNEYSTGQPWNCEANVKKQPILTELYWTDEVLDALAVRVADRVISRLTEATRTNDR